MDKKMMVFSFTEQGSEWNKRICRLLPEWGYACEGYTTGRFADRHDLLPLPQKLSDWIGTRWGDWDMLFIGASGIAVRMIAPWVKDKFRDSAVLVMDEKGQYVIPLLSGHIGGAVETAKSIAAYFGMEAVITTATDVQSKFAVDVFAKKNRLRVTDRELAKRISAAVLEGKTIGFYCEYPTEGAIPPELAFCSSYEELAETEYGIAVCGQQDIRLYRQRNAGKMTQILFLQTKPYIAGVGCRKGISPFKLCKVMEEAFARYRLDLESVSAFASIDLKKEEDALQQLAKKYQAEFVTYPAEMLKQAECVSEGSAFVESVTGVDNVCERAARVCCPDGRLILPKQKLDGATLAVLARDVRILFQNHDPAEEQRILIFSGTSEGNQIAAYLSHKPVKIFLSVATEYGKVCAGQYPNMEVLSGRMEAEEIAAWIRREKMDLVIDATHPFARVITENVKKACETTGTEYLRCLRESGKIRENPDDHGGKVIEVDSIEQAVDVLRDTSGNILITTGGKELEQYTVLPDYRERCFARVLSTAEAVEKAVSLGFEGRHLIAMQGPFSEDMNMALLRHVDAVYLVTKESGRTGGFPEKCQAAKETSVTLVVIRRPEEAGKTVDEIIAFLEARIRSGQR